MKYNDRGLAELFGARRELTARAADNWPSSSEGQTAEIEIEKIEAEIEKMTGSRPRPLKRSAEKSPAAASWERAIEAVNRRLP